MFGAGSRALIHSRNHKQTVRIMQPDRNNPNRPAFKDLSISMGLVTLPRAEGARATEFREYQRVIEAFWKSNGDAVLGVLEDQVDWTRAEALARIRLAADRSPPSHVALNENVLSLDRTIRTQLKPSMNAFKDEHVVSLESECLRAAAEVLGLTSTPEASSFSESVWKGVERGLNTAFMHLNLLDFVVMSKVFLGKHKIGENEVQQYRELFKLSAYPLSVSLMMQNRQLFGLILDLLRTPESAMGPVVDRRIEEIRARLRAAESALSQKPESSGVGIVLVHAPERKYSSFPEFTSDEAVIAYVSNFQLEHGRLVVSPRVIEEACRFAEFVRAHCQTQTVSATSDVALEDLRGTHGCPAAFLKEAQTMHLQSGEESVGTPIVSLLSTAYINMRYVHNLDALGIH